MIGKTISHYRIVEKLGQGGMGVVFKAEDTRLKRTAALKFLPPDTLAGEEEKARFVHEAQAAAGLDHPNICTIYEISETEDGQIFIAMAHYEGQTLKEKLTGGPLPVAEAVDIAIQVAQGLAKAHENGIIHRDIKPANLILTTEGVVKIVDFGLAKLAGRPGLTRTGSTMGTAAYMSPEQSFGEFVDHRTDIWSLGVMLYEMLAGRIPFRGEYEHAVVYSIINEEPEPISRFRVGLPADLERVITTAIRKQPDQRYATAGDLLADLRAVQQASAVGSPRRRRSTRIIKPGRRTLYGTLAGLIALVTAAVLYLGLQSEGTKPQSSIAVMPFTLTQAGSGWDWLRVGMADLLNTDLARNPSLRVLDARQQLRMMRRLGLRGASLTTKQALTVARKANVGTVLLGAFNVDDNNVDVRIRLLDAKTGSDMASLDPFRGRINDLYSLVDGMSSRVEAILGLKSPAAQKPLRGSAFVSTSIEAQRFFIEGLDAAYDLRHEESIDKLRQAITLDSSFVRPYYFLAWQLRTTGDYAGAKRILAKGKPYIQGLSEGARLHYLSNEAGIDRRWRDLATYSRRLLKIHPNDTDELYRYGWVLYNKFRELDGGIAAIEKAVRLDSTYTIAYNTLAYAYLAKGDSQKALQVIRKGIAMGLTDVNTRDTEAEILLLTGRYAEAIQRCERILELRPNFSYTPPHLIRAYLGQGRFRHAFQVAEEYTEKATNSSLKLQATVLQAVSRWRQGRIPQALALLGQAVDIDSTNAEARWFRGQVHLESGKRSAAAADLAALKRALERQEGLEGLWMLHHLRGLIAVSDGDYKRAVGLFERALRLYPLDRAFYLSALARALALSGQERQAIQTYQAALDFNPGHAPAAFAVARIYEKVGDSKKARQAYRRVVEIWAEADTGLRQVEIARRKSGQANTHEANQQAERR